MKLTIEIESIDGVVCAKMTRGEHTWERQLGTRARRNLYNLTDAIEARAYIARAAVGEVEDAWRRVIARDGHVSIAALEVESGLDKNRAAAALRGAMQRGKLTRMVAVTGHVVPGHYVEAPR